MADAALTLTHKSHALDILFQAHRAAVRELQRAAQEVLLQEVESEDGGRGERWLWAGKYLEDEGTMFRFYRKHAFSQAPALSAIRTSLSFPPPPPRPPIPHTSLMLLPSSSRPVLHVALHELTPQSMPVFKQTLLAMYESMRIELSESGEMGFECLVNVEGARVRDVVSDLVPWFMKTVQPRYPSMCGAVFVINYTWAYAGLWSIVRRVAPAHALSRIFFLSRDELAAYFPHCLPPAPSAPPSPSPSPTPPPSPPISRIPSRPWLPDILSFSAPSAPGPERTRLSVLYTLLRLWGQKLRTREWWGRWGWTLCVLLYLAGRWWVRRGGRRPPGR